MNGMTAIYTALSGDTDLSAYLDYPVRLARVMPGTVPAGTKTVNVYQSGVIDHRIMYMDNTVTASCRGATEQEAAQVADYVVKAVNRVNPGGGRFYCQQLGVIQPIDETDDFNIPVEIQIKGQTALS